MTTSKTAKFTLNDNLNLKLFNTCYNTDSKFRQCLAYFEENKYIDPLTLLDLKAVFDDEEMTVKVVLLNPSLFADSTKDTSEFLGKRSKNDQVDLDWDLAAGS